jgi:hypothetical protein
MRADFETSRLTFPSRKIGEAGCVRVLPPATGAKRLAEL